MTKTTGAVDLGAFDAAVQRQEEGIPVPILGMDGKTPTGLVIRVAGPDSDRAKAAQEALADEMIESESLRPSAREMADRGIRYLAKVTMGWEPAVVIDGQELSYSEENAEKLYRRYNFIKAQVDKAGGDRLRFLKG